jgi:ArpU family phage transcriptional regulator
MNYKKWLIEDLQTLERQRFAISQLREELETVEAEYTAIKATNYDKMPTGSGENVQEEKLLTAIAKKDELRASLAYTEKHVADMERLLKQLPDDERQIIERTFVGQEKYAAESLADELGYERRNIYRMRNRALLHLAQLRYGAAYRP